MRVDVWLTLLMLQTDRKGAWEETVVERPIYRIQAPLSKMSKVLGQVSYESSSLLDDCL